MARIIVLSIVLICFTLNISIAQSDFVKADQNAFSLSLSQSQSDFVANKVYSLSAMFTTKGRFDYGLQYSTFDKPVSPLTNFGGRVDTFTPTVNYLLVKSEGGTNIGAGLGYNFALNTVDVNDFVLGASLSQRIGSIDKLNVYPFFAISTTNGESASALGVSLVIPGKNHLVLSPSFISSNNDTNFSMQIGYIFLKDKNSN